MAGLTTYGADEILGGAALPSSLWLQLHTGDPGVDGANNGAAEDTRKAVTLEASAAPATAVNDAEVAWSGTVANETATYFTLWDDENAGNPWLVGTVNPPLDLTLGGDATLPVGNVQVVAKRHGD